ncbi:MAG: sterol desaturase family protein [Pseudomonadota bacterium]
MTVEQVTEFGSAFDDVFFLIGGALLLIEIAKGLFSGSLKRRDWLDMLASASTQIPYLIVEVFLLSLAYIGFVFVADAFVTWTFPVTVTTVLLAILVADFTYYWEHRLAHRIRILWTQHAVHHSSRHMNILVGVRFGPFEGFISALLHFPLILIGFPPELVFVGIIVVLAYQTWIHTELVGRLGILDAVLNTPSNHRVHHGCDDKYIDRNYGGILIVWDRLFGTYQREEETPKYGLKRDYKSVNPISVWFSEWPRFWRDLSAARSLNEAWMRVFGTPEWSPSPKPATIEADAAAKPAPPAQSPR